MRNHKLRRAISSCNNERSGHQPGRTLHPDGFEDQDAPRVGDQRPRNRSTPGIELRSAGKRIDGSRGEKMRYALAVLLGVLCSVSSAAAQVSIGIGVPSVSIGINLPSFPELVVVPDYPVYYAPRGEVNLFFYDGVYWAYQRDNWYASSWYNGPWRVVGPAVVPAFILRVPVRYYRHPPASWAGWRSNAPPRWGEHWGPEWEQRRRGWDQWDRRAAHAPAPLPVYQRQYSGNRYPQVEQQQALHREKYRYQPQDPVVRQHDQRQGAQPQPAVVQHAQQAPKSQGQQDRPQGKGHSKPEQGQGQEKGQGQGQEQEKGQGRNK